MTHKCTYGTHMTPKCLGATAPRFVEGTGALPRAKLGDFGLSRRSPADLGFKWYVHWVCRIPIGNSAQWASAKCRVTGSGFRFLYKTEHVMGGSLRWMAPEIATGTARLREQIGPVAQAAQVPTLMVTFLIFTTYHCSTKSWNVPLYLHHLLQVKMLLLFESPVISPSFSMVDFRPRPFSVLVSGAFVQSVAWDVGGYPMPYGATTHCQNKWNIQYSQNISGR